MSVTDAAVWSQVAASIAVVVTLIYLAIQVRQGAELLRSESRQVSRVLDQEAIYKWIDNTDLSVILGKDGELDDAQKTRLGFMLLAAMRNQEHYWHQYRNGVLDERTWESYCGIVTALFSNRTTRQWWTALGRNLGFDPEFLEIVEKQIADAPDIGWFKINATWI